MSTQKMPAIERTDHSHVYKNTVIPYSIWYSRRSSTAIETVIFLGAIQLGKLARWVAESCPPNTAVVQGAPHWLTKSDGSDIPEYMLDFIQCAFDTLLKNSRSSNLKVHVIAESQAAPGVLGLFIQNRYSPYLRKLALLQPLGFNTLSYAGADEQRIALFRQRIAANMLRQAPALLLDKRLRYNHRLSNLTVGIGLRNPTLSAHYNSGLAYDAIPDLKHLHNLHRDIRIICGANDKIFPPAEISATLAKNKIPIEVETISGVPHSPLATRHGQRLLALALEV